MVFNYNPQQERIKMRFSPIAFIPHVMVVAIVVGGAYLLWGNVTEQVPEPEVGKSRVSVRWTET
jgi:hypothetical protein